MSDPSIPKGTRDVQSVTKAGTPIAPSITGVRVRSTVNHVDHRGTVFEIFEGDLEFWGSPIVYAYQFSVRPRLVKGWGMHQHKHDRYTIISGEVLVLLYDGRADSPTTGLVQKVFLSDRAQRQLIIPPFVWHLSINLTDTEAKLINFPTAVYNHEHPDRILLPWNTPEIPSDIESYLPIF